MKCKQYITLIWKLTVNAGISLISNVFIALQINGIAVDNKSLSECEALMRNCRDSLSISLMKVKSSFTTADKE